MKFFEHPFFLAVICLITSAAVIGTILVTFTRFINSEPFSAKLVMLGFFWLMAAYSTGKRLYERFTGEK